ncbi:MAG: (Fe-S)-binding protein [Candidatus Sericytochromatia bacterium]|nr:(Fe-S)-binding protein [Candidatus Sericytochromatia bacterium]
MPSPTNTELLNACIHCGLCLTRCPTYRETGDEAASPRGRLYLMRALEEGRLQAGPEVNPHFDSCVGCRACETACPAGVQYGSLLERVRAEHVEPSRPAGVGLRAWRKIVRDVLPDARRLSLAAIPGRLTKRLLVRRGRAPGWLPGGLARALELLPDGPLRPASWLPEWTPAQGPERGVVAFLPGCAGSALYASSGRAAVHLLTRAGYRVWVPPALGCCGAVHLHEGDRTGAIQRVEANLAALQGQEFEAIISHAGGCGATLHEYGSLLPERGEAQTLASKATDLASFLVRVGLPAPSPRPAVRVTWHDPCHLAHGLGVRSAPRQLLASLPNVELVELPEADWCCGGAGTYTLKQAALSDSLLNHKLDHIRSTHATQVITANPPCLMQLARGLQQQLPEVQVVHLADFLAAYHP